MKFLLFNKEEKLIGTLKNILEAKHTEEINGEDTLGLITLDQNIQKGYKVTYKDKYGNWQEFIVNEIEESHAEVGIEKNLFCESSFYETLGDYIEDERLYNVTANVGLQVALEPTRWEVGIVDDLGIASINFNHVSSKEAVQKVVEAWEGEIRTRVIVSGNKITHRYVDLLAQRGQNLGKRFTYTKDLEFITKTVHKEDVITALYGYGKGEEVGEGYSRRMDFSEINNNKAYVENNEARLIWGRPNGNGAKAHVFGKVEFDDCKDPEELLELTKKRLEEVSYPLVTYEVKIIDLGGAELGDSVAVIDKEFTPELRLKARAVRIVRDLLEEENNDIILSNFLPNISDFLNKQQKYIDNFRDRAGVWDRAQVINQDGTINAQFLNDLVDELNTRMNSQGGYVFISEEGGGLITYDKPNPEEATMAIQLLGGAFRIAGSKKSNGEFDFRTFGDGKGFIADAFVGGLLKGGKVHFDLTNGTLLIGNSPNDYSLYWNGSTLSLNGGNFVLGGKNGDTATHTNQYSRYNHSDGSYTRISSAGMERYVSGSGKTYHHLIHMVGFVVGSSSVRWIDLPSEFRGKKFTVYVAFADSLQAPGVNWNLHRVVVTGHPDYVNDYTRARVPLVGYKLCVHKDSRNLEMSNVQGLLIAIY